MTHERTYKEWLIDRASELGIPVPTLFMRITRGTHPRPMLRRVNARVIFVIEETKWPMHQRIA
jgi:hypothetical protein